MCVSVSVGASIVCIQILAFDTVSNIHCLLFIYLFSITEQVAASGGYMMSCVADKIVASPFAVLGSIGVITEIPNFYDRLKEEGIEFQTVTAGKYKRTITPTKKITKEDVKKSKEDIESVFNLFKGWVEQNRPQLNIEEVATGETWFGPDALERGLCDEIATVDDILLEYIDSGYNVYEVKYDPPPEVPASLSFVFGSDDDAPRFDKDSSLSSIGQRAIRWMVRSFAEEVKSVVSSESSNAVNKRYMAKDDTADKIRASEDFY
jgi:ClpP class serine protease